MAKSKQKVKKKITKSAKKPAKKKSAVPKKSAVKKRSTAKATSNKKKTKKPIEKKATAKRKYVKKTDASKVSEKAPAKRKYVRKADVAETTEKKRAYTRRKEQVPEASASRVQDDARTATRAGRRRSKTKILPKEFLMELAESIKAAVEPAIRVAKGREVIGLSSSGDVTFELDKIAEKALFTFLKNSKIPVAYYSEDTGYTTFSNSQPQNLLIIDPIDGTRAAKNGMEGCVVSIGSTRVIERPTIADIESACILEILGTRSFYAERGKGTRIYDSGHNRRVKMSQNANLETMAWSMTVPARPADLIFPTAAKLIDITSLKGGFFACNSTSFSLTRLITNQLDACVDFANRYYRDITKIVEDQFINAGRGMVIGICPYDFAAALLVVGEAGCIATDAYGNTFDDVLLLDNGVGNQRSLIAASNPELHKKLFRYFDIRIAQLEALHKRRAKQLAERNAAKK